MTIETFVSKHRDSYSQARRFSRVPATFPVFIRSDDLRMADQALDLSEGGLRVETEAPYERWLRRVTGGVGGLCRAPQSRK